MTVQVTTGVRRAGLSSEIGIIDGATFCGARDALYE
jgi:hypothetical protein